MDKFYKEQALYIVMGADNAEGSNFDQDPEFDREEYDRFKCSLKKWDRRVRDIAADNWARVAFPISERKKAKFLGLAGNTLYEPVLEAWWSYYQEGGAGLGAKWSPLVWAARDEGWREWLFEVLKKDGLCQ